MLSKNAVKYIQSLSHKKTRNEEGLFVAEGPKLAAEILQSNFIIKQIFAVEEWIEKNNKVENVVKISGNELHRISNLTTPNEVVVIAQQRLSSSVLSFKNKIILALDNIQDPGNFGTIIRTADWFGIDTIIAGNDSADLYNFKVVQATMGSIVRVNVIYDELNSFLKKCDVNIYGAMLNGKSIYDVEKIKEGVIIIGNESKGISENILAMITQKITIPRNGKTESLNAAVATGIILSHLV